LGDLSIAQNYKLINSTDLWDDRPQALNTGKKLNQTSIEPFLFPIGQN